MNIKQPGKGYIIKKPIVYAPIKDIIYGNTRTKESYVRWLAKHLDSREVVAFPAYWNGQGYVLTDGNHRTKAAALAGYEYVPVVLLTKQEYDFVKYSTRHINISAFYPKRPIKLPTPPVGVDAGIINKIVHFTT